MITTWKITIFIGKLTISMPIFHSYVSLPYDYLVASSAPGTSQRQGTRRLQKVIHAPRELTAAWGSRAMQRRWTHPKRWGFHEI